MSILGFVGEIYFEDKVVAHYKDGSIVKGHTKDFDPARGQFTIHPYDEERHAVPVSIESLKAVFHVRTFEGNPERNPRGCGNTARQIESNPLHSGQANRRFADGDGGSAIVQGGQRRQLDSTRRSIENEIPNLKPLATLKLNARAGGLLGERSAINEFLPALQSRS